MHTEETTWAVVAFGEFDDAALMVCGPEFSEHLSHSDFGVGDVWPEGPYNRPGLGVWRWDGVIRHVKYDTDYGDEWDVTYVGEWKLLVPVDALTEMEG